MSKRLRKDYEDVKPVVSPNAGTAGSSPTVIPINATGYRRARFVFSFGVANASGWISSGAAIWNAATSGATSAMIGSASLAAITSGAVSQALAVIDVAVDQSYPWLLLSGFSVVSSAIVNAVNVHLYNGLSNPPATSTPTQYVTTY